MKLFYAPGACSLGIHLLLEEIGKPYEIARVDLASGAQYQPEYLKVNPKSKVPALLRDDGSIVTEYPAIATWLAKSNPEKNLIPANLEDEVRMIELMEYIVSTLHMQAFGRIFRPAKFCENEAEHAAIRETGKAMIAKGLDYISEILGEREFLVGNSLTLADSALLYLLFWIVDRVGLEAPGNLKAYYERLKARPTVKKVFADEGINVA